MALAKRRVFGASYSMSQGKGPKSSDPDMLEATKDHSP